MLKLAELPYRGITRLRRALYRNGILKQHRLPKPVISIGNIAAGGAGKTPCVIAIARFLIDHGYKVAVLTRGYGRSGEGGAVDTLDPARFGDEPILIKKYVRNADVIVGSNRYENGLRVNCDVYLLDDGFQHLQLARDFDLVIDVPNARFHREGRSALKHADAVIPRALRIAIPEELRGKRLFAFAGLADNAQFFNAVGAAASMSFDDHHRYTPADVAKIREAARNEKADAIVTTEKDAVKIAGAPDLIPIPAEFIVPDDVLQRLLRLLQ